MGKVLDKLLGGVAGSVVPGGKLYYKTLSKGISFLNKIIGKKKTKAEQAKAEAEARIAALKSLDFQGLQNAGVDVKYTPAQSAVFGQQESETKPSVRYSGLMPVELLTKGGIDEKTKMNNNMNMDWVKKNWYYVAGGAAVLYYLLKKKRR